MERSKIIQMPMSIYDQLRIMERQYDKTINDAEHDAKCMQYGYDRCKEFYQPILFLSVLLNIYLMVSLFINGL